MLSDPLFPVCIKMLILGRQYGFNMTSANTVKRYNICHESFQLLLFADTPGI